MRKWWIERRNAALTSSRFRRLALRLAPLRPTARRHARRLFDLVAGFTYSQTLFACVELGLFDRLAKRPGSRDELAAALDLPRDALDRLIGAAQALRLLESVDDRRVALGVAGAALIGNPGVQAMIAHHRLLYADLADPVALLRRPGGGALPGFWDYARGHAPDSVADYSRLMAASIEPVAEQLFDAYDLGSHSRLLDVGGGEGRFLAEVRRRAPHLALGLFDLPAVTARAGERLGDGVMLHPGDFRQDALPGGYDCVTLVRVLHDHDDEVALALLRAIRASLPPGGTLLIVEPMVGAPHAETVGPTYFAWYFAAMGRGRARSPEEIARMLAAAGFSRSRQLNTRLPLVTCVTHALVTKD